MGPLRYITSQRKTAGFLQAQPRLNGEVDPDRAVVHAVYTVEGGAQATETLLERGMTAVVCGRDLMALGAIRAIRGRGLPVPQDVSVVGYDDSPLMALTDPPLTTLRQDVKGMVRHAVNALVDEIRGVPHSRRELLFHAELVVRKSTAPSPDRLLAPPL